MKTKEKEIGVVSVESGKILIGDPCYWLSGERYNEQILKKEFSKFRLVNHNFGLRSKGKGVIVSSGYGDGCYPVFATIEDERVKEIRIKFF